VEKKIVNINYNEFNLEKLFSTAQELLKTNDIKKAIREFDLLKIVFFEKAENEYNNKLKKFKKEGGEEIYFEYTNPIKKDFQKICKTFQQNKERYFEEKNKQLNKNLEEKNALIEQIKNLIKKEEKAKETFEVFHDILDSWKKTGPVPPKNSRDLYLSFHHQKENFYDIIKINKELRDYDYKINLKQKKGLIKKAALLLDEQNIKKAFLELQNLHVIWKEETGPVKPDLRKKIWDNFSEITKTIHLKRKSFEKKNKEVLKKNTQIKNQISDNIIELANTKIIGHKEMVQKIKKVEKLKEEWKKTGPSIKEENEKTWNNHLRSIKYFNNKKNEFYKVLKNNIKHIIKQKENLCQKAEELENSVEWKKSTEQIKKIQEEWKKTGYLANKEGDEIWERFQKTCNNFFNNKKIYFNNLEKEFTENLKKKKDEIKKIKSFKPTEGKTNDINEINKLINNWKLLGKVPKSEVTKIQTEFNTEINKCFKKLNISEEEKNKILFKSTIDALLKNGNTKQLNKEKETLKKKLTYTKNEIEQLKANISLFSKSKSTKILVEQVEKKIQLMEKKAGTLSKQISIISNL